MKITFTMSELTPMLTELEALELIRLSNLANSLIPQFTPKESYQSSTGNVAIQYVKALVGNQRTVQAKIGALELHLEKLDSTKLFEGCIEYQLTRKKINELKGLI